MTLQRSLSFGSSVRVAFTFNSVCKRGDALIFLFARAPVPLLSPLPPNDYSPPLLHDFLAGHQSSPLVFSLIPAITVGVFMVDHQLLGTPSQLAMHCSPATSHRRGCLDCIQAAPLLSPLPPNSCPSPLLRALLDSIQRSVFIAPNQRHCCFRCRQAAAHHHCCMRCWPSCNRSCC